MHYMNFLFPILAAFLEAGASTLDKVVLSVKRMDYRSYLGISFPLGFLVLLVIFLIFKPPFEAGTLYLNNLWVLLILSICISLGNNILWYRALKHDGLGEMQTINILANLPVIILASIIFSDERNLYVLIPAILATTAMIWSHWNRHHFKMAYFTGLYLAWAIFITPIGEAILKTLLQTWNPISLELLRTGAVALVLTPFYYKYDKKVSLSSIGLLVLINILTTVAWLLYFFSYQASGIVYTVLIFSLQPLLVYLASLFLLKESLNKKKIIAFAVVLSAIITAQLMS